MHGPDGDVHGAAAGDVQVKVHGPHVVRYNRDVSLGTGDNDTVPRTKIDGIHVRVYQLGGGEDDENWVYEVEDISSDEREEFFDVTDMSMMVERVETPTTLQRKCVQDQSPDNGGDEEEQFSDAEGGCSVDDEDKYWVAKDQFIDAADNLCDV